MMFTAENGSGDGGGGWGGGGGGERTNQPEVGGRECQLHGTSEQSETV